jgi:hypothetical protein
MQQLLVLGLLVVGPASPTVALDPGAPAVVAEDGPNDMLMNPSRHTEGAARLGGTEIVNPPHESFGMMQKPTGPSTMDIRQAPTGTPVVSGAESKANATEVHELRAAAAAETGQDVREPVITPAQAAANAANAQAAGVQAAISSAKTSAAAAEEPPAVPSSSGPAQTPTDPDRGPDQPAVPDAAPPSDAAPAPVAPGDAPNH